VTVLHLKSKAGPDGIVKFDAGVPGAEVRATLEIEPDASANSDERRRAEWQAFVRRTAGCIHDPTFRRHSQATFPNREPLA
jgi:hypothetical protein